MSIQINIYIINMVIEIFNAIKSLLKPLFQLFVPPVWFKTVFFFLRKPNLKKNLFLNKTQFFLETPPHSPNPFRLTVGAKA